MSNQVRPGQVSYSAEVQDHKGPGEKRPRANTTKVPKCAIPGQGTAGTGTTRSALLGVTASWSLPPSAPGLPLRNPEANIAPAGVGSHMWLLHKGLGYIPSLISPAGTL